MKYSIIGSGFSGLSAAAYLSKKGYKVEVYEKNSTLGGRARKLKYKGYTFDMGPSWYWMPDVFENFFNDFNHKPDDFYNLIKLNPGFDIIFKDFYKISLSSNWNEILNLFESYEKGASKKLIEFINEAEFKYNFGIKKLVHEPGVSIKELFKPEIFKNIFKLQIFSSYRKHVRKFFKNHYLRSILEFPVLFLGSTPQETPALYSLMAYSGLKQGTFYPIGGFNKVVEGMVKVCKENGVKFYKNFNVKKLNISDNLVKSIESDSKKINIDVLLCSNDYQFVDQQLLPEKYSNYSKKYWESRVMSPSCLIFYLGVGKKLKKLNHHNLFFDEDIDNHAHEIYKSKKWPSRPLFYASATSVTDKSTAPPGKENIFILMPISPGLKDNDTIRNKYFKLIINRLEKYCNEDINPYIEFNKSYCVKDFIDDYNSYKGNAYGLANTLLQTANLKPKIFNRKIKNLFYTGQLTVPGPGVPPSIISGKVVSEYLLKKINKK